MTTTIILLFILFISASFMSALKWRFWIIYGLRAQRMQLAVILILLLFLYNNFQSPNAIVSLSVYGLGLVAIVFNLWSVLPFTLLNKVELPKAREITNEISLMTANVRMSNKKYHLLLEQIKEYAPDVILLTEVNSEWVSWVKELEETYLYVCLVPKENTYGMALYSKYPLIDLKIQYLVEENVPSIHCNIQYSGKQIIQFMGLHPKPPAPWNKEENKDIELVMVAGRTNENSYPSVVTGDLNDVAWSPATKQFKMISGLIDPRIGRGFFSTYSVFIPFFRMPIDHFFVSPHFTLITMKRLKKFGSDHFPVFIKLNLETDGLNA